MIDALGNRRTGPGGDLGDGRAGGIDRPQRRARRPPGGGRARRGGGSHAGHVTVPYPT